MKRSIIMGAYFLLFSIPSFALQPNFEDTVKPKELLILELAANKDMANTFEQQATGSL